MFRNPCRLTPAADSLLFTVFTNFFPSLPLFYNACIYCILLSSFCQESTVTFFTFFTIFSWKMLQFFALLQLSLTRVEPYKVLGTKKAFILRQSRL